MKVLISIIALLILDLACSSFYWYAFNTWTNIHPTFILVLLVSSFISFSSYDFSKI